jgi:hypothetical protein
MSDWIHLQTRAYPLHFTFPPGYGPDAAALKVNVPDLGRLTITPGTLATFEYNFETTAEADLTEIIAANVTRPGTTIAACRTRFLPAGAALVTYALRHHENLAAFSPDQLVAFDSQVNDELRRADQPILLRILAEVVKIFPLARPTSVDQWDTDSGEILPVDRRAVRYNCHVVAKGPRWKSRNGAQYDSHGCQILMPFTYVWIGDPQAPVTDLLAMMEPTDVAVAERSILAGATLDARKILDRLAGDQASHLQIETFRRFLDGVWADYYHLDSYRIESGLVPRRTFNAACDSMGMEAAQAQARELLAHVTDSLVATTSARAAVLDTRLNRVASALTVVTAAGFVSSLVQFLAPQETSGMRLIIVGVAVIIAASILAYTLNPSLVNGYLRRLWHAIGWRRPSHALQRSLPSAPLAPADKPQNGST